MAGRADTLRSAEAAVVSGLAIKQLDHVVEERVLPDGFMVVTDDRQFTLGACVMVAFYHKSAEDFSAAVRKRVIARFEDRLRNVEFSHYKKLVCENWKFSERYWTVDLAPFIESTASSYERLREAEAAVSRNEAVMSGAEVLRGTRVLVHDVAASANAGASVERIREAYPSLSEQQIELAIVYAAAHPARGRPRRTVLPAGAKHVERRVVQRKTAG